MKKKENRDKVKLFYNHLSSSPPRPLFKQEQWDGEKLIVLLDVI